MSPTQLVVISVVVFLAALIGLVIGAATSGAKVHFLERQNEWLRTLLAKQDSPEIFAKMIRNERKRLEVVTDA